MKTINLIPKIRTKKQALYVLTVSLIFSVGIIWLINFLIFISFEAYKIGHEFMTSEKSIVPSMAQAHVPNKYERDYEYNDQVPEEVILHEMEKLADRFGIDPVKWEKLLRNEASCTMYSHKRHGCTLGELDNLAENPKSTALGLGQYLINTWRGTESYKQFKISRTDYKAALWEMALDLSSGQSDKWDESNKVIGIYNYMK